MASVSRGSLYRRSGTRNWAFKVYVDGVPKRETTGTPNLKEAESVLRRRIDEITRGVFHDPSQRITFAEMKDLLLRSYSFRQNRTDPTRFVNQLAKSFGDLRGEEITEERIATHSRKRLEEDSAAPATLHRELSILRRMLRLASPRLPRVPLIDMPRVHNARQGFFEEEDLRAIQRHLPPHAVHLVEFLYFTGWRTSEALGLRWGDVDWKRQSVLLRNSKNREPRIFPFKYHPRLEGVLRAQHETSLSVGEG
jgi:integrase